MLKKIDFSKITIEQNYPLDLKTGQKSVTSPFISVSYQFTNFADIKQVIVLNDYITLSLQFSLSFPALRSIDFGGEIDYAPSLNSQRVVGRGK